jgi:hypothetical protein
MLEEALPLVIGVAVAMLPCLAFGSLSACRSFIFLGAGECLGPDTGCLQQQGLI